MSRQQPQQQGQPRLCECGCGEYFQVLKVRGGTYKRFKNAYHQIRAWRHRNKDMLNARQRARTQRLSATKIYKVRRQHKNPQKFCHRCNSLLDINTNWRPSDAKDHKYRCKRCINKLWPRVKMTPEQIREQSRTYYWRDVEKSRAASRKSYYRNRDRKLEYMRQYRRSHKKALS